MLTVSPNRQYRGMEASEHLRKNIYLLERSIHKAFVKTVILLRDFKGGYYSKLICIIYLAYFLSFFNPLGMQNKMIYLNFFYKEITV